MCSMIVSVMIMFTNIIINEHMIIIMIIIIINIIIIPPLLRCRSRRGRPRWPSRRAPRRGGPDPGSGSRHQTPSDER